MTFDLYMLLQILKKPKNNHNNRSLPVQIKPFLPFVTLQLLSQTHSRGISSGRSTQKVVQNSEVERYIQVWTSLSQSFVEPAFTAVTERFVFSSLHISTRLAQFACYSRCTSGAECRPSSCRGRGRRSAYPDRTPFLRTQRAFQSNIRRVWKNGGPDMAA